MADRAISTLPEATQIIDSDLFLLEQSGKAKKLLGYTLRSFLEGFVRSAREYANQALTSKNSASNSASAASASEQNVTALEASARRSAELAMQSAESSGFLYFEVGDDGHLYIVTSDNLGDNTRG